MLYKWHSTGGQLAIAYWSSSSPIANDRPTEHVDEDKRRDTARSNTWPSKFTIKMDSDPSSCTIVSGADPRPHMVLGMASPANGTPIYFTEEPFTMILNCVTALKHANVNITIARSSNQILQVKILQRPHLDLVPGILCRV
jgi:hypothetical protein